MGWHRRPPEPPEPRASGQRRSRSSRSAPNGRLVGTRKATGRSKPSPAGPRRP